MKVKNKIGIAILLVIVAGITLFYYGSRDGLAASSPKKGGMLTVAVYSDLMSADPHLGNSVISAEVMNHIFEPLIGFGEKMEFVPVLAERWEISKDYKTYTFYLRKGKLFHNGREMVADDVKYSMERIMDPKTKCPRGADFASAIESVEVKDKYTAVFHMKKENATLPYLLTYNFPAMVIVPREEVEKQGGVFTHPVGTGPYKFVEWKPGQYVLVERFDQYKPQPGPRNGLGGERIAYLDKIKWVVISEDSGSVLALLNKEVDGIRHYPPSLVEKFRQDYAKKGLTMQQIPGFVVHSFWFGCNKPVTNNVKFRQACAYAIDMKALARAVRYGDEKINPSLVSPQSPYWTPYHNTWYKKDVNKAKQLLREAGYKGEEVVIDTTKSYSDYYRLAVALQGELTAAGINARLNVLEMPSMVKKFYDGDFQIITQGPMNADPVQSYFLYRINHFDEQVPRMRKIVEEANRTLDVKVRKKLFEEAHKLEYEYVPAVTVHAPEVNHCYWNYVKGFNGYATFEERFWGVWLDK